MRGVKLCHDQSISGAQMTLDLIEYLAKKVVDQPESVRVEQTGEREETTHGILRTPPLWQESGSNV